MWKPYKQSFQDKLVIGKTYSSHGAELILFDNLPTSKTSKQFFHLFKTQIAWRQNEIKMFGKVHLEPRLTSWYGDEGVNYTYSGIDNKPLPWTPVLLEVKKMVEDISQHHFNSVLLNQYRNGMDSMGWHQDNEKSLGTNPVIASMSFGAERNFKLKHLSGEHQTNCTLKNGSLLIMRGETQHFWKHALPKTKKVHSARINLTFRHIKTS